MKIVTVVLSCLMGFAFAFAFAFDTNRSGSLYIYKLEDDAMSISLRIYGNKLYISDSRTRFDYDVRGTLSMAHTAKYLGISRKGKLKLMDTPQTGFLLSSRGSTPYNRALSFNGEEVFELCGDYSIGQGSECSGALRVKVFFQDLFH